MNDIAADLSSLRVGRGTVAQNLERAIAAGAATRAEDGGIVIPANPGAADRTMFGQTRWPYPCKKLLFLFEHAYDRAQVPWTCRNCYKVKASPRTLRELVAVQELTVQTPCPSKFMPEVYVPYSSNLYGAFYYADGLDQARTIFREVRSILDGDERVKDVPLQIKRGCTKYEMYCGPSDTYQFPDFVEELEGWLLPQVTIAPPREPAKSLPRSLILIEWIQIAYQIGDESYLDLTGGRRLFPKTVCYDP